MLDNPQLFLGRTLPNDVVFTILEQVQQTNPTQVFDTLSTLQCLGKYHRQPINRFLVDPKIAATYVHKFAQVTSIKEFVYLKNMCNRLSLTGKWANLKDDDYATIAFALTTTDVNQLIDLGKDFFRVISALCSDRIPWVAKKMVARTIKTLCPVITSEACFKIMKEAHSKIVTMDADRHECDRLQGEIFRLTKIAEVLRAIIAKNNLIVDNSVVGEADIALGLQRIVLKVHKRSNQRQYPFNSNYFGLLFYGSATQGASNNGLNYIAERLKNADGSSVYCNLQGAHIPKKHK